MKMNADKIKKIAGMAKDKIVYLPFVGWFITLIINHGDDDFIIYHIKQSFALALGFAVYFVAFGILLTLTRPGILNIVFVIIIYLAYLLYFTMSVIGTHAVLRGKRIKFPVISDYAAKLNI